ncbi:unnamed protein product [Calypogeia fissa]
MHGTGCPSLESRSLPPVTCLRSLCGEKRMVPSPTRALLPKITVHLSSNFQPGKLSALLSLRIISLTGTITFLGSQRVESS